MRGREGRAGGELWEEGREEVEGGGVRWEMREGAADGERREAGPGIAGTNTITSPAVPLSPLEAPI